MGPLRNYLPNFSNRVYYKQQKHLWACGKELGDRKQNIPNSSLSWWNKALTTFLSFEALFGTRVFRWISVYFPGPTEYTQKHYW
jgi:hypothetical protein